MKSVMISRVCFPFVLMGGWFAVGLLFVAPDLLAEGPGSVEGGEGNPTLVMKMSIANLSCTSIACRSRSRERRSRSRERRSRSRDKRSRSRDRRSRSRERRSRSRDRRSRSRERRSRSRDKRSRSRERRSRSRERRSRSRDKRSDERRRKAAGHAQQENRAKTGIAKISRPVSGHARPRPFAPSTLSARARGFLKGTERNIGGRGESPQGDAAFPPGALPSSFARTADTAGDATANARVHRPAPDPASRRAKTARIRGAGTPTGNRHP